MRKTTSSTGIARRHNVRPEGKRVASTFQHQRGGQLWWAEDVLTPLTHYFPAEAAHYPAPGGQWTWQLTCCVMCRIFNWREGNQGDMQQTGAGCREPIQSLVNMRNSRQCSDGSSQHHTWTPPRLQLPGRRSVFIWAEPNRASRGQRRPAERLHLQHFAVLSSVYLSANWHWFHLHAIFRTFGSALVSPAAPVK